MALALVVASCSGRSTTAGATNEGASTTAIQRALADDELLREFESVLSNNAIWRAFEPAPSNAAELAANMCATLSDLDSIEALDAGLAIAASEVIGDSDQAEAAFEFVSSAAAVAAEHRCPEHLDQVADFVPTLRRHIETLIPLVEAAGDYWLWVESDEFTAHHLSESEWLAVGVKACRETEKVLTQGRTFADVERTLAELVSEIIAERDLLPPKEIGYTASNAQASAYNTLCPTFLDASHDFWRGYDETVDDVNYLSDDAANDAFLRSLERDVPDGHVYALPEELLAIGADACDSFAYDFGKDLMREITDLAANASSYDGWQDDDLEAYKSLRLAVPLAAVENLCASLDEGVRPVLTEWTTRYFEPESLGSQLGLDLFWLPAAFDENVGVYEDLRIDNRDYWLELTLAECNRLDEQADPESVRAALTGPFISEGKQADEFDHDMAELLLFAMAYEACPRHNDLINDWIFGR